MRVATLSAVCAALVTAAAAYDYHKQPSNLVLNCKAREDRKFPDDNRRDRCLTWDEAICIQRAWDSIFTGIKDGGAVAREVLAPELVYYSQSDWWTTPGNPYYGANATGPYPYEYPPLYSNREQLIAAYVNYPVTGASYATGPYIVSCDSFATYWRGNLGQLTARGINSTKGRVNGIDMLFIRPGTYQIEAAFSEYNTLAYIAGGATV